MAQLVNDISDEEMREALSAGYGRLQGAVLEAETNDSGQADRSEWNRGSIWNTVYVPEAPNFTQHSAWPQS